MVFNGDRVFVYQYKDRKDIHDFSDLTEIEVTAAVDNVKNIIATGNIILNGNYVYDENGNKETISGIVAYKKEGNILEKGKRKFYISYDIKKKGFNTILKEYNGEDLLELHACLRLDEHVEIKLLATNICFISQEEAEEFIDFLYIKHPKLYNRKISIEINGKTYLYEDYSVYVNGKYIDKNPKERLIQYACKYKNPIKEETYDFNKVFSMRLSGYDLVKTT